MNTKLTLNVNKDIVEQAKKYAQMNKQSVSALVQNYLTFITEDKSLDNIEISPTVKELAGIITIDDLYDIKEEYRKHILEKYT